MHPISEGFGPLLGLPCWLTRLGHGSFVTIEFGQPVLDIREPRLAPVDIDGATPTSMQRSAYIHGQWHLWLYLCRWSVALDGTQLAHSESDGITINRALHVLDGQALTDVRVDPANGSTGLVFDLGCTVAIVPYPRSSPPAEPDTLWLLYQWVDSPGHVLAVRADGRYQLGASDTSSQDKPWIPIPEQA